MEKYDALSLLDFLNESPCNFRAVDTICRELAANGFQELNLSDKWELTKGGKYFATKNGSAVFAFGVFGCFTIPSSGIVPPNVKSLVAVSGRVF